MTGELYEIEEERRRKMKEVQRVKFQMVEIMDRMQLVLPEGSQREGEEEE